MSIELNDLSPLVPVSSIELINDLQSVPKLIQLDPTTLNQNFSLNHNSLMIAAESGDLHAVNLCLKSGFNVNEKVNGSTAVDLAWKNQHFEIVLDLMKANSQLPMDFDIELAPEDIKQFVESKKFKKFKIFGSDDTIKDCKSCGKHQIKILLALAIAFPIIIWFGLRLKILDTEPIYSCGNLTDELRLTFFHEFFEKTTLDDDVEQLTRIVNENFNSEDRKKILEGRHQAANFLRMSWQKRSNKNSTSVFMDAVNFQCKIENLKKIKSFDKFMKFLESENYSREELREFFMASLGTKAVKTDNDVEVFIRYAKKLLSKDDYAELSINWEPYEV